MINYNPGTIFFICGCHGSVFPKGIMWAVPAAALSVIIKSCVPLDSDFMTLDGADTIWGAYTFVLGFLVVFRNNQAYSRFWEGATLVQQVRGEWFNAISSLFAFCAVSGEKHPEVGNFQSLTAHLMSILFCQALQQICDLENDSLEIIDIACCSQEQLHFLAGASDRCEVVMQWLQRAIVEAHDNGVVTASPPILSRVFQELSRGMVDLNNARKIKNVPFPFPYAQMIAVMLIIHFLMTPVVAAYYVKSALWAGILSFLVTGAFWSLIYIAQEIDHPFGEDANDFNTAEIMQGMNTSLVTLLQPMAQMPPRVASSKDSHLNLSSLVLVSSDAVILGTAEVEKRRGFARQLTEPARVRSLSQVYESVSVPDPVAADSSERKYSILFSSKSRDNMVSGSGMLGDSDDSSDHRVQRGATSPAKAQSPKVRASSRFHSDPGRGESAVSWKSMIRVPTATPASTPPRPLESMESGAEQDPGTKEGTDLKGPQRGLGIMTAIPSLLRDDSEGSEDDGLRLFACDMSPRTLECIIHAGCAGEQAVQALPPTAEAPTRLPLESLMQLDPVSKPNFEAAKAAAAAPPLPGDTKFTPL